MFCFAPPPLSLQKAKQHQLKLIFTMNKQFIQSLWTSRWISGKGKDLHFVDDCYCSLHHTEKTWLLVCDDICTYWPHNCICTTYGTVTECYLGWVSVLLLCQKPFRSSFLIFYLVGKYANDWNKNIHSLYIYYWFKCMYAYLKYVYVFESENKAKISLFFSFNLD